MRGETFSHLGCYLIQNFLSHCLACVQKMKDCSRKPCPPHMTPRSAHPATKVVLYWVGNRQSESDQHCDALQHMIGVYETVPGWIVHGDQVLREINQMEPHLCFKSSDTGKWIFTFTMADMDENFGMLRFNSLSTGTSAEVYESNRWQATALVRITASHRSSGVGT